MTLKQPTVTDFAGRLCRFPPVSRRKGSMTSQSGIQWVMFALCHPPPPLPARLPLSDKPLSCPTMTLVLRLYLDASLPSGPSGISHAVIETLTVPWEVCWDPVQCAVLLFRLCCGCGGWCASSLSARCLPVNWDNVSGRVSFQLAWWSMCGCGFTQRRHGLHESYIIYEIMCHIFHWSDWCNLECAWLFAIL